MFARSRIGRPVSAVAVAAATAAWLTGGPAAADEAFAVALRRPLPFAGGMVSGPVSPADVAVLLQRPVAAPLEPGIDGVRLSSRDGSVRIARTCEDYLDLLRSGWLADVAFDETAESAFNLTCVTLAFLAEAGRPRVSHIASPRLGIGDVVLLPAIILPAASAADRRALAQAAADGKTVADLIDRLDPSTTISPAEVRFRYRGIEQALHELARADFDGDGVEDLLVFVDEWAVAGPYRAAYHLVLTRTSADGPFSIVSDG